MTFCVIYVIISFLLDGLTSNYTEILLPVSGYFKTIYTVISLVIILRYFDSPKKYLTILLILGAFFDIAYTDTILVNPFIFAIIYLVISKLEDHVSNNLLTINLKTIIAITIYHVVTYLLLHITNYHHFELYVLGNAILKSLIATVIYTSISYLIFDKYFYKKYSKKIR